MATISAADLWQMEQQDGVKSVFCMAAVFLGLFAVLATVTHRTRQKANMAHLQSWQEARSKIVMEKTSASRGPSYLSLSSRPPSLSGSTHIPLIRSRSSSNYSTAQLLAHAVSLPFLQGTSPPSRQGSGSGHPTPSRQGSGSHATPFRQGSGSTPFRQGSSSGPSPSRQGSGSSHLQDGRISPRVALMHQKSWELACLEAQF